MTDNSILQIGCNTISATTGLVPEAYGLLRVTKHNISYIMFEYQVHARNGALWRGYYNSGAVGEKWSGWQKISTSTPRQEYQLPRAEGIDGSCKYYRAQDQKCHIDGVLGSISTPILTDNKVIGTLPVGYRPIARVQRPATFLLFGGAFLAGTLFIEPNGTIITQTALDYGVNFAYFQIDF